MRAILPIGFVDDSSVLHIELGAKCGDFGKQFHAPCYLTDKDEEAVRACNSHHIDVYCDAHRIPWPDSRFKKVIMCNPYWYGFKDKPQAEALLNELGRVVENGGCVIVLASKTSPWGSNGRIRTRVEDFASSNGVSFRVEGETFDACLEYPGFFFQQTTGSQAFPNERTVLHVSK